MKIRVGIADDHDLIRQGIVKLLEDGGCEVVLQANNGQDLIKALKMKSPDVILMDINMPELDGIAATQWVTENKSKCKVVALTALNDDINIIRMLKAGARAYLLKSSNSEQLLRAVNEVHETGYHFSDLVSGRLMKTVHTETMDSNLAAGLSLTDQELEFIKHLCTELTNKEIADRMHVSPRTSEGWRKILCDKLQVNTRVGIVLFALRNKLVE